MVESDEALLVARSIESVQKREEGRRRPGNISNYTLEIFLDMFLNMAIDQ
jgi:hypothetical protein